MSVHIRANLELKNNMTPCKNTIRFPNLALTYNYVHFYLHLKPLFLLTFLFSMIQQARPVPPEAALGTTSCTRVPRTALDLTITGSQSAVSRTWVPPLRTMAVAS